MTPSKCALNKMFDIANDYAVTISIKFNASKCKYLVFGNNGTHIHSVKFNDVVIFANTWETQLCNHLDANDSDRHISQAIHLLYFRFNSVMHNFYSATSDLRYFLYKKYIAWPYMGVSYGILSLSVLISFMLHSVSAVGIY